MKLTVNYNNHEEKKFKKEKRKVPSSKQNKTEQESLYILKPAEKSKYKGILNEAKIKVVHDF